MDLSYGDDRTEQFVTNVGLITSQGPQGHNVMACEWTHHISYRPGLILVCINSKNNVTADNIRHTKEFGVNLCASDQSILSSVVGNNSGKNVDKIKVLESLGVVFYLGKKITALMIRGAVVNIECKLMKELQLGSHLLFFGEVVEASLTRGKDPLAYHRGKYWILENTIQKPTEEELKKIEQLIKKFRKT